MYFTAYMMFFYYLLFFIYFHFYFYFVILIKFYLFVMRFLFLLKYILLLPSQHYTEFLSCNINAFVMMINDVFIHIHLNLYIFADYILIPCYFDFNLNFNVIINCNLKVAS